MLRGRYASNLKIGRKPGLNLVVLGVGVGVIVNVGLIIQSKDRVGRRPEGHARRHLLLGVSIQIDVIPACEQSKT